MLAEVEAAHEALVLALVRNPQTTVQNLNALLDGENFKIVLEWKTQTPREPMLPYDQEDL